MMNAVADVSLEKGNILGGFFFFLLSMMGKDAPISMS